MDAASSLDDESNSTVCDRRCGLLRRCVFLLLGVVLMELMEVLLLERTILTLLVLSMILKHDTLDGDSVVNRTSRSGSSSSCKVDILIVILIIYQSSLTMVTSSLAAGGGGGGSDYDK